MYTIESSVFKFNLMSQWGGSIVWDIFKGDERMGTHNHENMPHGDQIWKLEFADRDENGTIYWYVVNHMYPAKRLAIWKRDNDFKSGTQDKGLEHMQMWNFEPVEGRSNTYLIKNKVYPNRVWRKWGEDDEEVGTDTIAHARNEGRLEECYWKVSSIMENPDVVEDEIFRYDNHLDRPSIVTAEIKYGASTTSTNANSLSISASMKAAFSTSSSESWKNSTEALKFKGKAAGYGIAAKIGFTQAFDWTTSRSAYYKQSSKFKIKVDPGKSVRLLQPVLTMLNTDDKENILVVRSQTFRRIDDDIQLSIDEQTDEQEYDQIEENTDIDETEAFHILEHGALYTITNAGQVSTIPYFIHVL